MSNTVILGGARALCLSIILVLAHAQAADLYVSTSGSDSNAGSSSQPFRTITYAYSKASAGTTIHVLPGVYTDYTSGWGIHLGKSGTASSPIVLHSETRGGAIIDGGNASDRNQGFYIDGSYNTVDGFEIRNNPNGGISIWANGNRIINNDIHNNGNPASSSTNGRDGVYSNEGTSGNYYANNSIHDNGRTGSNYDHGLYLCGQNETVINNLLYRNASSGLQIAGYTSVSGMKVYNNVMAWNGRQGIILWMALSGVDIKNNIIYENAQEGIHSSDAHGSGVVFDHNLNYGNGTADYNFTGNGSDYSYSLGTTISADPRFVNGTSASFDPHLGSGSPCIGAGLNLSSTLTADFNGAARPATGTWDLGAYVNGGATATPVVTLSAPTNGANYSAPATINLAASVTANGHTITKVQFYEGTTLLAEDSAAPYTFKYTDVSPRSCAFKAMALYDSGASVSSTAINIVVSAAPAPPSLQISLETGSAHLRWPTNLGHYVLQSRIISAPMSSWVDISNVPAILAGQFSVYDPASGPGVWYRLRSQ